MSGISTYFPHSRILGGLDRTWTNLDEPEQVDWVPGAFVIVRPEALAQSGLFDLTFFLYYEEVDLCMRIKQAGWQIWYWPDIVITHIGGESSRSLKTLDFSSASAQVVLWRMRSTFLYYRKYHGHKARLAKWLEAIIYTVSAWRNDLSREPWRKDRAKYFRTLRSVLQQAWIDTKGGRVSPPAPW